MRGIFLFLFVFLSIILAVSTFKLSLPTRSIKRLKAFNMIILPIRSKQMIQMAPRKVTNEQWKSYWGMNSKEVRIL